MPELKKSEKFGIGSQLVKICQVPLPSTEPVNPLRWLGDIYLIFPSSTQNTLVKYANGFTLFFFHFFSLIWLVACYMGFRVDFPFHNLFTG